MEFKLKRVAILPVYGDGMQICDWLYVEDHARAIWLVLNQGRPGHDRRYAIDCTKINREFGWKPVESFAFDIEMTVDWDLKNRAWAADITSKKYSRERLGTGK